VAMRNGGGVMGAGAGTTAGVGTGAGTEGVDLVA
jgi:hypothetical protein